MTTPLEDLFTDYNAKIVATADEIEAWNTLDPVAILGRLMSDRLGAANTVTTSVGLFGYALDDFLEECATLEVDGDCEVADYDAYTGWAVGVFWSGIEENPFEGVVFTDSLWSVQVAWGESNTVKGGKVDDVAADLPTALTADLIDAVDGFASWGAEESAGGGDQFAFSFFEDEDDFYFEAEDTTSIWATVGATPAPTGNVETTDFVLVGAASLTAVTSVIVASLLF